MNLRNSSWLLLLGLLFWQLPSSAQDFSEFLSAFNSTDYKQAVSMGEDFIKRYPKHAEARYYLARSYMKRGQAALAESQLHTALSLEPTEEVKLNCIAALKEISQSNTSGASSGTSKIQAMPVRNTAAPASSSSNASKGISTYPSSTKNNQRPVPAIGRSTDCPPGAIAPKDSLINRLKK